MVCGSRVCIRTYYRRTTIGTWPLPRTLFTSHRIGQTCRSSRWGHIGGISDIADSSSAKENSPRANTCQQVGSQVRHSPWPGLYGINPFFLIWWATVGSLLVTQALILGAFLGVLVMFGAHIWMDYAWLGGAASLAPRGGFLLGKWYRAMLIAFGLGMLYFGGTFIASGLAW